MSLYFDCAINSRGGAGNIHIRKDRLKMGLFETILIEGTLARKKITLLLLTM
jgi:hypothetical protein